jgi:hypothetical protein
MSTAEALCIKYTLTDQIGLGHLISKHEMFCFEKTVFKTFKLLLEYLIFRKTVSTVRSKFSLHESCKQHHIRIDIPYLEKRTLRGRYSNSLVIDAGPQFSLRTCSQATREPSRFR